MVCDSKKKLIILQKVDCSPDNFRTSDCFRRKIAAATKQKCKSIQMNDWMNSNRIQLDTRNNGPTRITRFFINFSGFDVQRHAFLYFISYCAARRVVVEDKIGRLWGSSGLHKLINMNESETYPHKTASRPSTFLIEINLKMLLPNSTNNCSILNNIAVGDPFCINFCK